MAVGMQDIKWVQCPKCQQKTAFPESTPDKIVTCRCKHQFSLSKHLIKKRRRQARSREQRDRLIVVCRDCKHYAGDHCGYAGCEGCRSAKREYFLQMLRRGDCPLGKWEEKEPKRTEKKESKVTKTIVEVKTDCAYLGEELRPLVYTCGLYGECTKTPYPSANRPNCETCKDKLFLGQKGFHRLWRDPLHITTRDHGQPTKVLENLLQGRSAFLMCGGPSANDLPLEKLRRRGCFSLAVNNMAGHARHRPNAFVCSDPPMKFSSSIWLDPAIMKFVPTPKLSGSRSKIRVKRGNKFVGMKRRVTDMPNVWGFKRRSWLEINETFFTEDSAAWGNQAVGCKRTGEPKTACTMLLGLRMLYYLGARRIFLIGCDFRMSRESGYAFEQGRTDDACESNNRQYGIANDWLCRLQQAGIFKSFGLEIYNCFDRSGLRAFEYCPFDDALEDVCVDVEEVPDLAFWYEKKDEVPSS